MIYYAAMDSDGEIFGVEEDVENAIDLATDIEPDKTVQVQTVDADDLLQQNPAGAMAKKSARNTGIGKISARAGDMDLDKAHKLLFPYFDGLMLRGQPVKTYNNKSGMIKAWIGQNYKTSKETPENPSKVMGLSILPHHLVVDMARQRKIYGQKFTARLKRQMPKLPSGFTLCTGSNQLCRDSCLVFAGQNAAEVYNSYRKAAQTLALLNEPEAFMRIMVAAIEQHQCMSPTEGFEPYMRLNVLSDIPWEITAPWLFDRFPDLQFYDYTKVTGRDAPSNYDLTFSFSGTNEQLCRTEIDEHGRRVAVVFLAHKEKRGAWAAWKRAKKGLIIPLPKEFWGLPVIDGDTSDVRPLDIAPSIVGLRWKSPSGARAGIYVDPSSPDFTFVVPVYVVDGGARLTKNPWTTPNPAKDQWLVAAVTPRFQPIAHDVAQPGL